MPLSEEATTDSSLSSPPESVSRPSDIRTPPGRQESEPLSSGPLDCNPVKPTELGSIVVKNAEDGSATVDTRPASARARGEKRKASTTPSNRIVISSKRARNEARRWQSPFVFTDPKTPLASSNLRAILLNSRAWDVLSSEEQKEILALLPEHSHITLPGSDQPRPDVDSLQSNDTFRSDSARCCESIGVGKHDPDWLHDAWVAHKKRNRGDFDDYQVAGVERDWDVEISPEKRPGALRTPDLATSKSGPGSSESGFLTTGTSVATDNNQENPKTPSEEGTWKNADALDRPVGEGNSASGDPKEVNAADPTIASPEEPSSHDGGSPGNGGSVEVVAGE